VNLGTILLRMIPERRCGRCGANGYVDEKSFLCCACVNISLLRFRRWKKQEARLLGKEVKHGQEKEEGKIVTEPGTK